MVNEDIVTVLRNAVNSGDNLQHAIQVLINSGYDATQVQEASKYVQGGAMPNLQPKQDEQLIMAQNKGMLNRNPNPNIQQPNPSQQTPTNPGQMSSERMQSQQHMQQALEMNKQPINQPNQMQNARPAGQRDPYAQQSMNQNEIQQLTQPIQQQPQSPQQPTAQPPTTSQPQQQQPKNPQDPTQQEKPPEIKLKKKSHKKEIILLVILIFLIGVLISTIFFRKGILSFLSG